MCYGLPRIVSGPVAGRLIDRFPPRVLLTADNATRAMLTAAVPALLWSHHLVVADLYGIVGPAVAGIIVATIGRRAPWSGRGQLRGDVPLGSALGGVLIDAAGVRTVVLVIACGYLAFGLLPLLVPALRQLADAADPGDPAVPSTPAAG